MTDSYVAALLGGALLGLAGVLLMLFNGRILGVSGIFNGAILPKAGDAAWRWAVIAGLLAGGAAYTLIAPAAFAIAVDRSVWACALAGLLVGVGTQFGSGCTSGHGICGIGRLSKRSMAATVTFILAGGVSVWITVHVLEGGV